MIGADLLPSLFGGNFFVAAFVLALQTSLVHPPFESQNTVGGRHLKQPPGMYKTL